MQKQIENMAEEILEEYTNCYNEVDQECLEKMLRKLASDVAEEIFAEIESVLQPTVSALFYISETLVEVSKSHITEEQAIKEIREHLHGTICSRYRLENAFEPIKKKYTEE